LTSSFAIWEYLNRNLFGVGSVSHAVQTANLMLSFEKVVIEERPDWIVVVGDVNSTAVVTGYFEDGQLRSRMSKRDCVAFDRAMAQEIIRLVTDAISDMLFSASPTG
jgi:UDP-N-acetylglucosamine 2-epimerase (non-hydrolysing)